ncbi:MAG: Tether containing UBX domain for GLUT4 [Claussenomyces sp. TS43310]|nr:MAG: Tether containing UBX domain for GLUT4 [Claussenomyces sp. TS43310]
MASHVVVIDTTLRRTTVKVSPGTYISDVLHEACRKLNLKSDNYGLKHSNKAVDMSRTIRQAGLSSGAKVELVIASKSPSVVSVALQVPESDAKDIPSGRLIGKFPSNTTLWLILRQFETDSAQNLNFTGRGVARTDVGESGAGRIYYETPVLNIMGRELSSFADLQKTMAQLGINSGSSLIRLAFKKTDTPLEEAMAEIGGYFKLGEEPGDPGGKAAAVVSDLSSQPEVEKRMLSDATVNESNPELAVAMDLDPPTASPPGDFVPNDRASIGSTNLENLVVGSSQRPISVFAAPTSDTPKAAFAPYNETDYEPTIAHAKLHQNLLQSRTQNVRLPSDAEEAALAAEKAALRSSVKEVSVKVRFPDQLTVVSTFTNLDSGAALHDFVKRVIVAEDQPFALVWMGRGPQTVPNDANVKLIKDLGFQGRMLVNFHWQDAASDDARRGTSLKAEFATKAKELQVRQISDVDTPEQNVSMETAKDDDKGKSKEGGKTKGTPKWLKLPGKK